MRRAPRICRGVRRYLLHRDYETLVEFSLTSGRRADIFGLDKRGGTIIVEIKSNRADFRADTKWPDYLPWCDRFFFAVDGDFPVAILPPDQGVLISDGFRAVAIRPSVENRLAAARRRSLMLRFGHAAAARLHGFEDPNRLAES